ncbi:MAG TPA: hypothetical protein PKH33_08170, partial [bacterium]|nr:hypothetical protein [bacterium]
MSKKFILLVSVAIIAMGTQSAMANFDKTLNYQGRLTDSNGMPIADNSYSMTFRIYSVDTGGAAVWTSGATTVVVSNGLFSALLSGGTPDLDTLDFNTGEFWLEVTVAGTTYSPRQRMAANAMAINADMVDGYHASDFAAAAHSHATLTRGTGLTGSNYDGSAAQTWAVDFGIGTDQAARGDHTHTGMVTGSGTAGRVTYWNAASTISSGNLYWDNANSRLGVAVAPGTYALNVSGTANISGNTTIGGTLGVTGAITGSSTVQGTRLISTIVTGTAPLTVASTTLVTNLNADLLDGYHASDFAASTHSHATLTRGTGLTGSNYDGSAAQTWAVDFGVGTDQAARGDHTHTGMVTGSGTADRVTYWNTASTISSGNLYWDNANSRLGIGVAPGTYALNVSGTANISGNTTIGGTLGVTGTITGSDTITGTRFISTIVTGTAPLTVASTTLVTNLNADMLDGYHAADFAAATHTHAQLTAGTGILLTAYDGSTARSVALDKSYTDSFYVLKAGDTMTGTLQGRQLNPTVTNTYTLGTSALRYSTAYMVNLNASGTGTVSGLLTLGTQATGTGHAVRADRTITAGTGLSGGGDLTANRTISLNTTYTDGLYVLKAGDTMTGTLQGQQLNPTTDHTYDLGTTLLRYRTAYIQTVTLSQAGTATTSAVRADRTITAGTGLSGGGNLTADRTISLDTTYTDGLYVLKAGDTMTGTLQGRQLNPTVTNTYTLGTSALRYSTAYMVNLNASGTGTVSGLLTLGTQATGTGHAVRADRTITAGTGLSGGGDLTANRTISLNTTYTDGLYVLKAGDTMTGTLQGQQLNPTTDHTYDLGTTLLRYRTAYIQTVTLSQAGTATTSAVRADRTITAGTGLSGGG